MHLIAGITDKVAKKKGDSKFAKKRRQFCSIVLRLCVMLSELLIELF